MPKYLAGSQIGLVWKEPAPGLRQDYTLGRGEGRWSVGEKRGREGGEVRAGEGELLTRRLVWPHWIREDGRKAK